MIFEVRHFATGYVLLIEADTTDAVLEHFPADRFAFKSLRVRQPEEGRLLVERYAASREPAARVTEDAEIGGEG